MTSFNIDLNDYKNHTVVIEAVKKFGVSLKALLAVIDACEEENVVYAVTKEMKVHRLVKKLVGYHLALYRLPRDQGGDWVRDREGEYDEYEKSDISYLHLIEDQAEHQKPLAARTAEQQEQVKVICAAVKQFAPEYKEFLSILDQCDTDLCENLIRNKLNVNDNVRGELDSYFQDRKQKENKSWAKERPDNLMKMLMGDVEAEMEEDETVAEKDEEDFTSEMQFETNSETPESNKSYPMCPLKATEMYKQGEHSIDYKIMEIKNENGANRKHVLRAVLKELEDYEATVKMLKEEGKLKENEKSVHSSFADWMY